MVQSRAEKNEKKLEYYRANKERLKANMRAYSERNKLKLKSRKQILQAENKASKKFECATCGIYFTTGQGQRKHLVTKRHLKKAYRPNETPELPSKQ